MMLRCELLVTCVALSTLLTSCTNSTPDTHAADELALKDTEAAWVKDAATKDLEKFIAYYADDGSVLLPDTPILTGKEAIRGTFKPMLSDPNFAVTFGATKVDVAKSGDLGYTQGPFSMTTSDPKTKAPVTEKGKYLTVFRKQADGAWRAVEDTFMSDAPRRGEAVK